MTGLGEPVYVEKNDAVAEMVENAARSVMLSRNVDFIGFKPECHVTDWRQEAIDNPHVSQALNQAQSALESLVIPLTVLAALRSGEWVAVPRIPNLDMADAAIMNFGSRSAWDAMISASPKEP